jgi:hypothetical protein
MDPVQRQIDAYLSPVALNLLDDCAVMLRHSAANGLKIPDWIGNALAKIGADVDGLRKRIDETSGDERSEIVDRLRRTAAEDLRALTRIHGVLAETVAPATPASIRAIEPSTRGLWAAMKGLPLIGFMSLVAAVALVFFVALSSLGWFSDKLGDDAVDQLTYLSAAAIGASFYALFTAHRYVVAGTFDPRYTMVYWSRLFLGLIAGVILANFMPQPASSVDQLFPITQTSVALLGGYSAEAVNRILRRLVDMLLTLVKGDIETTVAARELEMKARLKELASRSRLATAASLLELSRQISANVPADKLQEQLQELISGLASDANPPEEQSSK